MCAHGRRDGRHLWIFRTERVISFEKPECPGYPRFLDNEWHCIPDELARSISLVPVGDGGEGQDWVLTYTPKRRDEDDREKVLIRLTP